MPCAERKEIRQRQLGSRGAAAETKQGKRVTGPAPPPAGEGDATRPRQLLSFRAADLAGRRRPSPNLTAPANQLGGAARPAQETGLAARQA